MKILVTGGAGYIGSMTCVALLQRGHEVVILDNLCNSRATVVPRIEQLGGGTVRFVRGDVRDEALLLGLFEQGGQGSQNSGRGFDAVIHFAGLKAVGESVRLPLDYYDNNVHGSRVLLSAMRQRGVRRLVFSSSATVYAPQVQPPMREDAPTGAINPYGRSKWMVEQMLADLAASEPGWALTALRYFNPVGAHPSGRMGEDPRGVPNNLMPFVSQVAVGRRERLQVFGNDYATPDGTGVRDYIHVSDLAAGHVAALDHAHDGSGLAIFNLGTGRGHSVLELVAAFERASGRPIPLDIVGRRPGDAASTFADPEAAQRVLGWRAGLDLQRMCEDSWRWQSMNPQGYPES